MILLDGNKLSNELKAELAEKVKELKLKGGKTPHLAAVLVGDDGASITYVNHKVKSCEQVGFKSTLIKMGADISEQELLMKIEELNINKDIDGFIVQLPLPKHISVERITEAIDHRKDVDGFHPVNVGRMVQGLPCFLPATPMGILTILQRHGVETDGRHCVVVGRSNIVGKPMSILMARNYYPGNCTVTLAHRNTVDLKSETLRADILIVAVGIPEMITADMVKEGAVVIDVGITRLNDPAASKGFRLKGDVKFDEVSQKTAAITPVPGGVGPMTVTALLLNTWKAANKEVY